MSTAFANNPDSSELLRFPLTYDSYFLIRLAYGYLDPASALGSVGLLGILIGVTVARPLLFPWALVVLATLAVFNLVLMQTIFAWLERWLAQRRTREILGVLFIFAMLSFQLIGPAVESGVEPSSPIDESNSGKPSSGPGCPRHCPDFARTIAEWLRGVASDGNHHRRYWTSAASEIARAVSRRKLERGRSTCQGRAGAGSAVGMESAGLFTGSRRCV
ncbi:MAG: hypothetical protein DMG79_19985 [Acidobacteria bacterium]|nr:MAG: hypothetical protein DMG79_19985 [Acidobacteriota bacterium]